MIEEIKADADDRMGKSLDALHNTLGRIRTGRANPSLLDGIEVPYYGNDTPLNQVASVTVEDARTLVISPWEKNLIQDIEKAILKSDLGITPSSTSELIRVPLPALTEERRKDMIRVVRHEAEGGRIAVRNIRRDALSDIKDLLKEKMIGEDDEHRAQDEVQTITDTYVAEIDQMLADKEAELLEI